MNVIVINSSAILISILTPVLCFVFKEKEKKWAKIETTRQEKQKKIDAKKATTKVNFYFNVIFLYNFHCYDHYYNLNCCTDYHTFFT